VAQQNGTIAKKQGLRLRLPHPIPEDWALFYPEGIGIRFTVPNRRALRILVWGFGLENVVLEAVS